MEKIVVGRGNGKGFRCAEALLKQEAVKRGRGSGMDEQIRTDNTETLSNALKQIAELERENAGLKAKIERMKTMDAAMAEAYADEHAPCFKEYPKAPRGALKQSFLAGLEKSRPKWHDMRENPEDLPEESIPVLALSSDGSLDECIYIPCEGFKDTVFSTWYDPVAWIEKEKILPKM